LKLTKGKFFAIVNSPTPALYLQNPRWRRPLSS
jgi:hypothetical protein